MNLNKTIRKLASKIYYCIIFNTMISISNLCVLLILLKKSNKYKYNFESNPLVYIFGWYGSETTGDKAILKGIVNEFLKINPDTKFILGSYNKYFSEKTVHEIKIEKITRVYDRKISSVYKAIKKSNVVVIGGGPLMEDVELFNWLKIIILANVLKKPVLIYGCGIGPIYSKQINKIVENIINLSDNVLLRDIESVTFSKKQLKLNKIPKLILDPSINFIEKIKTKNNKYKTTTVGVCIRDWPKNYYSSKTNNIAFKNKYEFYYNEMVLFLEYLLKNNFNIRFIAMNCAKNDNDLNIAKKLMKKLPKTTKITISKSNLTPKETFEEIQKLDFFIGMRFHSVIFSIFTNTPVIGIDYTYDKNGKIYSIMKKANQNEYCINISNVDYKQLIDKFSKLVKTNKKVRQELKIQTELMKNNNLSLKDILKY